MISGCKFLIFSLSPAPPLFYLHKNALVQGSIVGWHSTVGRWARLFSTAVLGEDVHIADEVLVNGGSILPHKSVSVNIMEPKIVM